MQPLPGRDSRGGTPRDGRLRAVDTVRLVLASRSPRRAALLRQAGLEPDVRAAEVPEERRPGETPGAHVLRLAEQKARAAAPTGDAAAEEIVLGADTVVVLDGEVLGKPGDAGEARRMLRRLSGRTHDVLTAVFLLRPAAGSAASAIATTRVRFRPLDAAWVEWYVSTGEPQDKAGGYGIQERGVLLVEGIEGSWSNVVGLPLELLPGLFREVGVHLADLVRREAARR